MMCSSRRPGRAFVFGQFDGDIDERHGNQYQGGRNLRTGHNIPNAYSTHSERLSNVYANHVHTIPMRSDRVKANASNRESSSNPGAIKMMPYQPAARLPLIPETTLYQERLSFAVIQNFSPQYSTVFKTTEDLYAII